MRHEVTMPQLGMAQDTGKVVAWMKSVGDSVDADETLMEVETDKATMEVPAGRAGVLAEILADAGAEVPVGDLIAVISDEAIADTRAPRPEAAEEEAAAPAEAEALAPVRSEPESAAKEAPAPGSRSAVSAVPKGGAVAGRVLASPKAKRLAAELGVDLRSLVRRGAAEPVHAADVEAAAKAPASMPSSLGAVAAKDAIDELLEFLRGSGYDVSADLVWASFVSGALRAAGILEGDIAVSCRTFGAGEREFVCRNADLAKLSSLAAEGRGPADIVLTNLTESRFTSFAPGLGDLPHLVVAAPNEGFCSISLQFSEREMPTASASAFLEELIERVEHPVRHLL